MTNPQTDPEVELEEGEIEDDGCEVETESAIGKSNSDGVEGSKVETNSEIPEEDDIKDKGKPSNGVKTSKKSRSQKEKALDFDGKKKYVSGVKMDCWDMVYNDCESEDDKTYHQELEEVLMKINSDKYGRSGSESVSGEEEDKPEEKRLRNSKRYEENDEPTKYPPRYADKKSKIICKFFLDGNCMKGADCHYSHDKNIKIREKDICKSFKAMGQCPYGKKCRYLHFDGVSKVGEKASSSVKLTSLNRDKPFQSKKEPPSRKRRNSSDKDESDQPPRKKIPSLLDLNVIPKGQSEEDVGKALMIAAKRSTSLMNRANRKMGLLGNSPENNGKKPAEKAPRKVEEKRDFEMDVEAEKEAESTEDKNAGQEKEDFGDKDERMMMHFNDIDERQSMNQLHSAEGMNKMEDDSFKVQQAPQSTVNVRALLGDAPAPPNNGPNRVPLLGNAPANFNLPFPQFPRHPMRPNQPPLGLTQTLGLIMNQNMGAMPHPQPRMLNPGLLPHPINPPRGPNGGFNPRPFGSGMQPNTFMGPQNLGLNQIPNSLLPLPPMNIPREPPFVYANGPLTMPGHFPPEEAKLHQCDKGGLSGQPDDVVPNQQFPNGLYDPKIPNEQLHKFPPVDHNINPVRNSDPPPSLGLRNENEFDAFPSGFDSAYQDKDMRISSGAFFDNPKSTGQSFFADATTTITPSASNMEDIGGIKKTFSGMFGASFPNDVIKLEAQENKDKGSNSENLKVQQVETAQVNTPSVNNHETSSISLSVANEVSFDCKLKGPYSLQRIDVDPRVVLPHFVDVTDPDWLADPRVQKHKDDPVIDKKPATTMTTTATIASNNPVTRPSLDGGATSALTVNSMSSIAQTRDPRLLKRNRKEADRTSRPSVPGTSSTPPLKAPADSAKPLETLEEFLRRYSSLPLSELNKGEEAPLEQPMEVKSEQEPNAAAGASQLENLNAAKKSYHNLIVKKSSASRLSNPVRSNISSESYNNNSSSSNNNSSNNDEDEDNPEESRSTKKAKVSLEFQSPLMSDAYSVKSPTLQYGLPPNGRFREPAGPKASEPTAIPRVAGPPTVPDSSLFMPSAGYEVPSEGCVKSLFNNIDPTASPFL